jgi:hypothetical protein
MAVPRRFVVAPSAATRELWRVVESGELDELADVLQQADVNARNEHGMTALMRAAYHGRIQMVRVLLEHGADPNLTRNDNFTALSLAAFFGHSEIVEMLIGRGARTDVATRYGTSAHMWAKARSFGDVAQCLQKRRQEQVVVPPPAPTPTSQVTSPLTSQLTSALTSRPTSKPAPLPEPEPGPAPELTQPELKSSQPAVRTLGEPPEIWDLVHEAPRDFSAGSAFVARVGSITAGVALGIAAFVVLAGSSAGLWYWKDKLPRGVTEVKAGAAENPGTTANPVTAPKSDTADKTVTALPAATTDAASIPPSPTVSAPTDQPIDFPSTSVPEPVVRRNTPRRWPKPQSAEVPVEPTITAAPLATAPKTESANPTPTANKHAAPVGQQLISTPKPQPPKAKVIQWP